MNLNGTLIEIAVPDVNSICELQDQVEFLRGQLARADDTIKFHKERAEFHVDLFNKMERSSIIAEERAAFWRDRALSLGAHVTDLEDHLLSQTAASIMARQGRA